MTITYPCSFESVAEHQLEEMLPFLHPGSLRKVKTLSDAINGKIKLVEGFIPDQPKKFVVKQVSKTARCQGLESPRNEIHASLAIQKLQVPNIAEVFFAAKDEKFFYLASEDCPHGDLLTVVNNCGCFKDDALLREALSQILIAVKALHKAGVAHRDLSLENVLVASDGSLRLIDWAQAIMVRPPGSAPTTEAVVSQADGPPGKPNYRGPELESGAPYLATKTDMFAIGVMLYALVVGSYPKDMLGLSGVYDNDPWNMDFCPTQKAGPGRCTRLGLQLQKACGDFSISPGCIDMMAQLLAPNPELRLSAEEALMHPWLTGAVPGVWPAADSWQDCMEEVSTQCTNDIEETDNDSIACGDGAD